MNILISDSWLREFVKTKATPEQIKEYLSLCGPSIERLYKKDNEVIYDIEITGNRPDAMSVVGVAREAAAILPRFGIAATFTPDITHKKQSYKGNKKLMVKTDALLNPRWVSIVLSNIRVGPSPSWLAKRLEQTGIRPINNVVDITNYLMRTYGQPAHAYDYEQIQGSSMTLRESRKGEKIVTLDGKTHVLPGGDIVIQDGGGRLIDLCGIMGGYNTSIKNTTTTIVLFLQTYSPVHIRKTSMALAHRTEAAALFEKDIDSEGILPVMYKGIHLMEELARGRVASALTDIYPKPYKPTLVSVAKEKITAYMGTDIKNTEIESMLKPLGFVMKKDFSFLVPSYRRDVQIDVDIIEEIARIYGYHNISSKLPEGEPPVVLPDRQLAKEQDIKICLRGFGFTEIYTYSMISKKLLGEAPAYKIVNPLSVEWEYMRPTLTASMIATIKDNSKHTNELKLFELSMVYQYRKNDLPLEIPSLIVGWSGTHYRNAKGIAEVLGLDAKITQTDGMTILEAPILFQESKPKHYIPIPKYPPIIEDFSFVVPPEFQVGPFIEVLSKIHARIRSVTFLDAYENKRTFRVAYQDPVRTLTTIDVAPLHQKFLEYATEKFNVMESG